MDNAALEAKRIELGLEPETVVVDTDKCVVKTPEDFLIHDISDETCVICDEVHGGVCTLDIMYHEMKFDEWVANQCKSNERDCSKEDESNDN